MTNRNLLQHAKNGLFLAGLTASMAASLTGCQQSSQTAAYPNDATLSPRQQEAVGQKARVVVLTDAETDDRCSMVHFLLYANDMDVEAIVQSNSCFQVHGWSSEPWLEEQICAYEKVYPNLKVHDPNYPTPDFLRSRVYLGDEDPSHVGISGGQVISLLPGCDPVIDPTDWPDTPGSDRIVELLLDDDPRPIYIGCWGGGNTAAKAFQKLQAQYPDQYERAIRKAVLYCIWYQDAAGSYIERNHPGATILLNHHFQGSWDYGSLTSTDNIVTQYMRNGKNPLGECYTQPYISEGDTPAFLYAVQNGLRSYEDPTYGGWGGRFYKVEGFENVYRDTGFGELREWTENAMHDFTARLIWCYTPEYAKANHKPEIKALSPLDITVHAGDTVRLEAEIFDPDSVDIESFWKLRGEMLAQHGVSREEVFTNPRKYIRTCSGSWYQAPGGTYDGKVDLIFCGDKNTMGTAPVAYFVAPKVSRPETIHVILEVYDFVAPRLYNYQRYIVTVEP